MFEKHIGKALAEVRNARKITQRELGEKVEMHFSTVSAVENGKRSLELPILQRLCDVLEVPVTDITDVAYASFRQETLESLRKAGGRLPEEPGVLLSGLESQATQLMQGRELLINDLFRFVRQLLQDGALWHLIALPRPENPPPSEPPRRRGRPPASAKAGSKSKKGSPAGKKKV